MCLNAVASTPVAPARAVSMSICAASKSLVDRIAIGTIPWRLGSSVVGVSPGMTYTVTRTDAGDGCHATTAGEISKAVTAHTTATEPAYEVLMAAILR